MTAARRPSTTIAFSWVTVEVRGRPAHGHAVGAQVREGGLVVAAHEVRVEQHAHAHAALGIGGQDGRGLVVFELVDLEVDAVACGAQERVDGREAGVGLDDQRQRAGGRTPARHGRLGVGRARAVGLGRACLGAGMVVCAVEALVGALDGRCAVPNRRWPTRR